MDVPTDAILVSQSLRALIADGAIGAVKPVLADQVQPSSLDLRVGARIWQLQCSFLPGRDGVVRKLGRLATAEWRTDRDRPLVLHRGGVYLAEVEEVLELPEQVWGRGNPKSSTGRLDVFVRLLTEFGEAFDTVPPGYQGRLYLEITPQSFHIGVRRGDRLGQIRLGSGRPGLSAEALESKQAASPVVVWSDGSPAPVVDAARPGVLLSVDLEGVGGPVGYLARRHQPPVDLTRRNLPIDRYWTSLPPAPVLGHVLEPEQFYIFATRERLRIPPDVCAELLAFDATKGELRTHYAGFIDPGFGWFDGDPTSSDGARLVLEIRTHDVPFLLEHGQPLFRLQFMANEARPDVLYGASDTRSHYQMQGLRLAKQFAAPET